MLFSRLIAPWKDQVQYQNLKDGLTSGKAQLVTGLTDLPRSCWVAALQDDVHKPVLVLTATDEAAKKVYADLATLLPSGSVSYFAPLELLPYEVYAGSVEIAGQRISALTKLTQDEKAIVVCPAEALLRKIIPKGLFQQYFVSFSIGQKINLQEFIVEAINMGDCREELVEVPGTFSVRGGIIDIFPFTETKPYRIELFDDEIESMRIFDTGTQRSLEEVTEAILSPVREIPADHAALQAAGKIIEQELRETMGSLTKRTQKHLQEAVSPFLEFFEEGIWHEGMEQFLVHIYPKGECLIDYLPQQAPVIIYEPNDVHEAVKKMGAAIHSFYYDLLDEGKILPSFARNFIDSDLFLNILQERPLILFSFLPQQGRFSVAHHYEVKTRELPSFQSNTGKLAEELTRYRKQGYQIIAAASTDMRVGKLRDLFRDIDIDGVEVMKAAFPRGFESMESRLLVLSEADVLGGKIYTKPRRAMRQGEKINTFLDLKPGDYVVHVNHGIGRYLGVVRLDIGEIQRDYLHIQYQGEDKLYVPTDQVDLIQKYVGADGHAPKLYKLGGTEWNKVKNKVRRSVQDMAKELLELYASREALRGFAFSPDVIWQKEFEDAFPYLETPDQLRAVEEIKKDMENIKPMDRLLCGDVGYGKTEVALRAAFKAIMDGKQVAVLVPTTVLAQQHQRTFEERFEGFPVTVGVLSRFKSSKAINQTLKGIAQGTVDVIIGTHRLLSKDVKFKDLGLLIIDEEQRFGVTHKEKIKGLKKNIDVLTLSATPIPRTLHMSLVGVRDMSVIQTPPEDRQPVHTYVMEYQERVIKEAICREIARNGQVYYVHNRVHNIYRTAEQIQKLVPEVRIMVAHGQMKERELEMVMLDFVAGKGDVLVCTTIVESGLDIPNVNTLIIDEADSLGLSQLYQLRGRVGRSEKRAFAYFTYRKDKILSGIAKKRLKAIRDFTELGSGFKIAMRDLEIRGAGNILGPEQHGHILAVGFDLYCRLIDEEVQKKQKGEETLKEEITPLLELNVDAFIPDSYLSETGLKIELYKRLAGAESIHDVDELEREIEDRYGVMPEPLRNLFKLGKVKVFAKKLKISAITNQKNTGQIRFAPEHGISGQHLAQLAGEFGRRLTFSVSGDLEMRIKVDAPEKLLPTVLKLLEKLLGITEQSFLVS
jgi:transcription-repair coupling factor (superfamily II helicase)